MDDVAREALEAAVRRQHAAGELDLAMRAAIAGYGPELYGFLVGLAGEPVFADDVFGATCERLWKGFAAFRWEASFRVWAYTVARNEFLRARSSPVRREIPVSEIPSLLDVIDQARTATPVFQQTPVRDRFAALRETLSPDDHMLLGLRLDRRLAWNEIATVLDEPAATLRKRFERLKDKLRRELADVRD